MSTARFSGGSAGFTTLGHGPGYGGRLTLGTRRARCRCNERRETLDRVGTALAQGDVRTLVREASFAARTTVEDLRTGALQREALLRLARLLWGKGR